MNNRKLKVSDRKTKKITKKEVQGETAKKETLVDKVLRISLPAEERVRDEIESVILKKNSDYSKLYLEKNSFSEEIDGLSYNVKKIKEIKEKIKKGEKLDTETRYSFGVAGDEDWFTSNVRGFRSGQLIENGTYLDDKVEKAIQRIQKEIEKSQKNLEENKKKLQEIRDHLFKENFENIQEIVKQENGRITYKKKPTLSIGEENKLNLHP